MRKRKGKCRGYSHMQGTSGEYFWNCLYFAQPLKRQPLSAGDFFETFFFNGEEMRKGNGRCWGPTHMQGTSGKYFWNCLYFAQPLERQHPLPLLNFFETFLLNGEKMRNRKG